MNAAEHERKAYNLLRKAEASFMGGDYRANIVAEAQAHATLAQSLRLSALNTEETTA